MWRVVSAEVMGQRHYVGLWTCEDEQEVDRVGRYISAPEADSEKERYSPGSTRCTQNQGCHEGMMLTDDVSAMSD